MPTKSNAGDSKYDPQFSGRGDLERLPQVASAEPANGETWIALCAQAAVEQDPRKLLELVSEINRLLDVRKKRLAQEAALKDAEAR